MAVCAAGAARTSSTGCANTATSAVGSLPMSRPCSAATTTPSRSAAMTRKTGASDDTEDEREDPLYSYPALKVDQNGHLIYFTTIPIDDLFPYCFVERQNENPEQGYQRKFEEHRANEIAEYLNTEGESILSNIVLSAKEAAALTYTRKTKQLSYQRAKEAFSVIDGQHRLWG